MHDRLTPTVVHCCLRRSLKKKLLPILILISNKTDEPFYYANRKGYGGKAAKK
jgi:hypothetical protein